MNNINVIKRNGEKEPLDIGKIHKVITWACEGLENVSVSEVEMKSKIQFCDNIKTADIHQIMVKSAADLISERTPNYQYVAARLAIFDIRKKAFGDFPPPDLYTFIQKMVSEERYDHYILDNYSQEEINELNDYLVHDRDFDFAYAAVKQLEGKYLLQDRTTGQIYESPQLMYAGISLAIFAKYPKETRMSYVKRFYDAVSKFVISLPTPIMAGLRTKVRQFASCVLINVDDSLDSLCAANTATVKYVSQKAGIGLNLGAIRAVGTKIRDGQTAHTGNIPFYKWFQAAVKSCSQGGVRGGAATVYYPLWHKEAESLLVLKNNRGVEDNRARHMDYGVQINKTLYTRLIKGGNISLFSPNEVPGLLEAFYADQDKFEQLYAKYEADESIERVTVKAVDLFSILMQERASTGRIYIQNVDHCNTHSAFNPKLAPVTQSNLCVSGDTMILTSEGHRRMDENVGEKFTIWNGYEWSENVEIVQTNTNQKLYRVTYSLDGGKLRGYLDATEYHKWYIQDEKGEYVETRTNQLKVGDKLETGNAVGFCEGPTKQRYLALPCEIESIEELEGLHDTYCVNEPLRHKVIFNGILTGNCSEINLPTKPMSRLDCTDGEIALCILAGVNMGKVNKPEDMEDPCDLLVRALDAIIDYQEYPVKAAENSTINRRMLGIGVINHAYFLAKHFTRYSDAESKKLTHRYFEALQYYCLKASNNLAKELGACKWFNETTYAQGLLPIDTYKKDVDAICDEPLHFDWEALRQEIKEHGLRNSALTTQFPSETSSQISNATNGIEPPRGYISIKASKDGILKQVVPEFDRLRDQYELLWDMPSNKGYLENVAIMQKFIDQSISTNTNYDPKKYPDGKVPMKTLLQDLLMAYKLGLKTLYYQNTRDGADDKQEDLDDGCAGGACKL